jgi:flagellar motor switch protein FliN/FliY
VDAPQEDQSDSTPETTGTPADGAGDSAPVADEAAPADAGEAKSQAADLQQAEGSAVAGAQDQDKSGETADFSKLPKYSRSLLKIRVPISVQLATKKELVHEVLTMAPGSIIKFEKGCEELLQMIVGEQAIAEGEAVKIGEKFGFRVTSMMLPREHFVAVKRGRSA